MDRLIVAAAIVAVAAVVALVLRRRGRVDPPTQARRQVPEQLNRRDFAHADREWLLVVFSSATCPTCEDLVRKAQVLESTAVGVVEVEWSANRDLHTRYAIDSVPLVVLADRLGVVRRSFVGPVDATELWVAVADARET